MCGDICQEYSQHIHGGCLLWAGGTIMGDMGSATAVGDPGGGDRGQGAESVRRKTAGSWVRDETDEKLRRRIFASGGAGRYEGS